MSSIFSYLDVHVLTKFCVNKVAVGASRSFETNLEKYIILILAQIIRKLVIQRNILKWVSHEHPTIKHFSNNPWTLSTHYASMNL